MRRIVFFFSIILALAVLQSCQKDSEITNPNNNPNPVSQVAPELPPKGVFIMPFTGFESVDTPGVVDGEIDFRNNPTFRNWFHSAFNLVVWNAALGITLAVPVAAFKTSFNFEANFIGDATYLWTYDVPLGNDTYTANLTGQFLNPNQVEWTMKISKAGSFTDVTWYTGIVSTDFSQANWTVFQNPENPEPFLNIEFLGDLNSDDFDITYTNITPNSPNNGNYITFSVNEAADFNRAYDVSNNGNLLEIEWDVPAGIGRVKDPNFFNDEDYHCWDSSLMDVDCE